MKNEKKNIFTEKLKIYKFKIKMLTLIVVKIVGKMKSKI